MGYRNSLSGQIPTTIGELRKLNKSTLSENYFSGTLPEELNQLVSVEILAIQREGLNIPTLNTQNRIQHLQNYKLRTTGIGGQLPSFSNLKNLKELYLGSNQITGKIPTDFLIGLHDKSRSIKVDLTMNKLEGTIPAALSSFDEMDLFVAGNKIEHIPAVLCQKEKWLSKSVSKFGCDAIACPPNTASKVGRQTSNILCTPCMSPIMLKSLIEINTSKASYFGSTDCLDGHLQEPSERDVLEMLYHATNGPNWTNNENWMNDTTSICDWFGVECIPGSEGIETVSKLQLYSNNLSGLIPGDILKLPSLRLLDFHDNFVDVKLDVLVFASKLEQFSWKSYQR